MTTRPLRADAARNRARIVAAARTLIGAGGVDVAMDDIAEAAGVAVGTLYRHFPAKADLVAAIVGERIAEMGDHLDSMQSRMAAGADVRDELVAFVTDISSRMGEDRALKAAAGDLLQGALSTAENRARVAITLIVEAGHRCAAFYPDVTVDDIALIISTMPGVELPDAGRRRWLDLMLRGVLMPATAADPGRRRRRPGT